MELILTPHIRLALTPALLEEVAADPKEKYRGAVAATLRDTAAMKDELEDGHPLPALASVARIRDLHGKVSVDFQKLRALRKEHGTLPLPPLPGIKGSIVPLRNQAELVASCNRKVDAETRKVVEQWLEPYRLGV